MKSFLLVGVFAFVISNQSYATGPMNSWTVADINKKMDGCFSKFSDLLAKAKGGDKAAQAALPAERDVAVKCLTTEQVFDWMFYYGWDKTGIYSAKLMGSIEETVGPFDWILTVANADTLQAYCDADKVFLHQAYCYMSLFSWWENFGETKSSADEAKKRIELYYANIEKAGAEINKQIFALPETTKAEKEVKTDRLSDAADWWFEDAANYMDLREAEEKANNSEPPVIIEGFRRSILALQEIVRIDPQDVSTISDIIWMQSNVDASDVDLAKFRGKKADFTSRPIDLAEKYEKANLDNFFFYSYLLDTFYVGTLNWQIEDLGLRKKLLDYLKHLVTQSEKTITTSYADMEALIKARPSDEGKILEEFVKNANTVISSKVRVEYFNAVELVGGAKDAREARKTKGSVPKPIRLGAGLSTEQEEASIRAGATHIVKSISEVKAFIGKSIQELTR